MRYSIRGMLLLTAAFAAILTLSFAWPTFGALIGPAFLVGSSIVALVLGFSQRSLAKLGFRISLATFFMLVCLYLSIGPASWIMARYITPNSNQSPRVRIWATKAFSYFYIPVATNAIYAPTPIRDLAFHYVKWWMPNSVNFEDMGAGMGWSDGGDWYTIISYRK